MMEPTPAVNVIDEADCPFDPSQQEQPHCEHNLWVRQRLCTSTEHCHLQCLVCESQWTTNLRLYEKCRDFYHGVCDLAGKCPCPHVVHPKLAQYFREHGKLVPLRKLLRQLRQETKQKRDQDALPELLDDEDTTDSSSEVVVLEPTRPCQAKGGKKSADEGEGSLASLEGSSTEQGHQQSARQPSPPPQPNSAGRREQQELLRLQQQLQQHRKMQEEIDSQRSHGRQQQQQQHQQQHQHQHQLLLLQQMQQQQQLLQLQQQLGLASMQQAQGSAGQDMQAIPLPGTNQVMVPAWVTADASVLQSGFTDLGRITAVHPMNGSQVSSLASAGAGLSALPMMQQAAFGGSPFAGLMPAPFN